MAETIAAIATPLALGGVAMIRISGDEAIAVADQVFHSYQCASLQDLDGYQAAYGTISDENGVIDDGVALVYRAPKSYTGEDVVELSCHGGVYVIKRVLRLILEKGASLAEPGEFSKRAFLNGKLSLTQAESIMDLIQSKNEHALRSARAQMDGALYQKIESLKESLLTIAGHLAAWTDYPEEEIEEIENSHLESSLRECKQQVDQLIHTFDTGKMVREGIETAIVGKTNVGKSTLMNLLSGCEKSIVTDIAGTTRDVVEETVNLGTVVLRLADTAGIRETEDFVEQKGVERSKKRIQSAGLVLAVFDYSEALNEDDRLIIEAVKASGVPALAIVNKTDLNQKIDEQYIKNNFKQIVYTNSEDVTSLERVTDAVESLLQLHQVDLSDGMIANERQRFCALEAQAALKEALDTMLSGMTLDAVNVMIDQAIDALLQLTGEKATEKIVDQVFHHFCVGK
jgi:tRNA modification GTPase